MSIRHIQEKDLPTILEIYNDAILNTTATYKYEVQTLAEKQQWLKNLYAQGYNGFVYEIQGKVVGFANYSKFREYTAYKYTVENSVYLHQDYRGQGIGSKLLDVLVEDASQKGFAAMISVIDVDNQVSQALARKKGFQYVGTLKRVGYKFDRWLDAAIYQKML